MAAPDPRTSRPRSAPRSSTSGCGAASRTRWSPRARARRRWPSPLADHPGCPVHVHHDERSAGFLALGLALGTGEPAVVLTTSGTAAAELHPAVVEADLARVPLLVCTADRPPELQRRGRAAGDRPDAPLRPGRALVPRAGRGRRRRARPRLAGAGRRGPGRGHRAGAGPGAPEPRLPRAARRAAPAAAAERGPRTCRRRAPRRRAAPSRRRCSAWSTTWRGRRGAVRRRGRAPGPAAPSTSVAARPRLAGRSPRPQAPVWGVAGAVHPALRRAAAHRWLADALHPRWSSASARPLASRVVGEWIAGSGAAEIVVAGPGRWIDPHGTADVVLAGRPGDARRRVGRGGRPGRATPVDGGAWRERVGARRRPPRSSAIDDGAGVGGRARPSRASPGPSSAALPDGARAGGLVVDAGARPRVVRPPRGRRSRVHANRGANGIDGVVSTAVGVALGDRRAHRAAHRRRRLPPRLQRPARRGRPRHRPRGRGGRQRRRRHLLVPPAGGRRSSRDRFELLFGTPHGLDLVAVAAALRRRAPGPSTDVGPAVRRGARGRRRARPGGAHRPRRQRRSVHDRLHAAVAAALERERLTPAGPSRTGRGAGAARSVGAMPGRRTKIVATIGPASDPPDVLRGVLEAGADVCPRRPGPRPPRGEPRPHRSGCARRPTDVGRPIGILVDLPGPKVRTAPFGDEGVAARARRRPCGSPRRSPATRAPPRWSPSPWPAPSTRSRPGDRVALGDGGRRAGGRRAAGPDGVRGRRCSQRRRRAGPARRVAARRTGSRCGRRPTHDLGLLDGVLDGGRRRRGRVVRADRRGRRRGPAGRRGSAGPMIVAKIETGPAVANLDDILHAADGVMVARGDLGVRLPLEDVPHIQKQIIRTGVSHGKPVITATQMLESMVTAPDAHPGRGHRRRQRRVRRHERGDALGRDGHRRRPGRRGRGDGAHHHAGRARVRLPRLGRPPRRAADGRPARRADDHPHHLGHHRGRLARLGRRRAGRDHRLHQLGPHRPDDQPVPADLPDPRPHALAAHGPSAGHGLGHPADGDGHARHHRRDRVARGRGRRASWSWCARATWSACSSARRPTSSRRTDVLRLVRVR